MCNAYRLTTDIATVVEAFADLKIEIRFGEGRPNLQARDEIRITDTAPVLRTVEGERGVGDLVQRRWSWPGPKGRPVYNFRSEGREFASGRCLVLADGFYEFTAPHDPKKKRKDKWLFTMSDGARPGAGLFCIAGIWRRVADVGEAFTLLTMPPGPDVAPYHDRQIVILDRSQWTDWLDPAVPAASLIRALAAGALSVEQVG